MSVSASISPVCYTDYFWPRRAGLIPHLIGGSLAITAGPCKSDSGSPIVWARCTTCSAEAAADGLSRLWPTGWCPIGYVPPKASVSEREI